jgi:hypothetical protein
MPSNCALNKKNAAIKKKTNAAEPTGRPDSEQPTAVYLTPFFRYVLPIRLWHPKHQQNSIQISSPWGQLSETPVEMQLAKFRQDL